MKHFLAAFLCCVCLSSASAQTIAAARGASGSELVLHFSLAAEDESAGKSDKQPYFDPGTGYMIAGGLVMLGGVAVVFGGIGLSIVSQPSPPPNPFFASFSPAEGYLTAAGGAVVVGVGVFLVWLGLEHRAEAHRPKYSWSVVPAYDPFNRVPVVSLSRMW